MTPDNQLLNTIFNQFQTQGTLESCESFGSGHINDTFLAKTCENEHPNYILQRINHQIFTNPIALMHNVVLVTQRLQNKIEKNGLTVILSRNQEPIVIDKNNHYWACYLYVENSKSIDVVKNSKQAYEGGKVIGNFLHLLADFPCEILHITIPNFHNVALRLDAFEQALINDCKQRARFCQNEIEFVRAHGIEMQTVMKLGEQGKIPLRVVHNDTKFNNVLLDLDDNGLCLIDLDTVMPGYIHYDFSDAVRTIANSAAEDEKDLSKIQFNTDFFTAFCEGFLEEIGSSLLPEEINSLAASVPLMPFLHGLRFLTDYLAGDVYYKIHFPEHNLQRAQAQFHLVKCMLMKMPLMKNIIQGITSPLVEN